MPRALSRSLSLAAIGLLCVDAKPEFARLLPNGAIVPGTSALGHADGTGASDKLNAFGAAFEKTGLTWTIELCQGDADGDGQTNGQELGDPCCVWTTGGAAPAFSNGVSHPGDAISKVSADVLARSSCTAASASTPPSPAGAASTVAPPSSASSRLLSSAGIVALAATGGSMAVAWVL